MLATLLVSAAAIRFATVFLFFHDYRPMNDAMEWHQAALNFLDGRGLIVSDALKASRTPVPGLYFATMYTMFGPSVRPIQIGNVFLGIVTVWLVFDFIRRTYGILPASCAAAFVCVYPPFLLYTGQMLSETPVLFFISLGLWLVWRLRDAHPVWFIPVGVVWGLATLTRETVLPMAGLVAIWSLRVRRDQPRYRRVLPALVILCGLTLAVLPWSMRNYLLLKRFVPLTSQGGVSLWIANNPLADGTAIDFKFPSIASLNVLPEVDRGLGYQKLAVHFILDNPLEFVRLALRRLLYFWHLGYHGEGLYEIVFLAIYLPMLALAGVGVWLASRRNLDATLLLSIVAVSLTVVHMVFLPEGRYRLPVDLIMCIFAGIGLHGILTRSLVSEERSPS